MSTFRFLAAAACLALLAGPAAAQQTFELGVAGTGVWESFFSATEDFVYPFAWSGVVTVMTSSGADGTYSGEALDILTASGHINPEPPLLAVVPGVPGGVPAGQEDLAGFVLFDFPEFFPVELQFLSGASVTIVNGAVSSIKASAFFPTQRHEGARLTFSDLGVTFNHQVAFSRGFTNGAVLIDAQGVLTPVPEPEIYALLMAGLVGVVAWRRTKRSR